MSQYLVLSKIRIQNANTIAGFTWGFPAITQFMGFIHALNRKISSDYHGDYDVEFSGCMIIANDIHNKVYQPKPFADFEFLQSKNPPVLAKHKASSPPIIEEGKLNATISLVVELKHSLLLSLDARLAFENKITALCKTMRIAGGNVLEIGSINLLSANTDEEKSKQLNRIKRLCMPGFVLKDQSGYLAEHTERLEAEGKKQASFTAWLDFIALKATCTPLQSDVHEELNEQTDAIWQYEKKPKDGYLVPIVTGFKAIAPKLKKEEVLGIRVKPDPEDQDVKQVVFVEAVHSVGEWLSMHRVKHLSDCIWRYHQDAEWYLCKQNSQQNLNNTTDVDIDNFKDLF